MRPGENGADIFGGVVGTGQAGAIGLVFLTVGILGVAVAVAGFLMPSIRRIETTLPDQAPEEDIPEPVAAVPAESGAKR
jgi:DHA3 family macrolide efflux protein-like MFS transporter